MSWRRHRRADAVSDYARVPVGLMIHGGRPIRLCGDCKRAAKLRTSVLNSDRIIREGSSVAHLLMVASEQAPFGGERGIGWTWCGRGLR